MLKSRNKKINSGSKQYIATMVATLIAMVLIVSFTFTSVYSVAKNDVITIGKMSVIEKSEQLNNFLLKGMEALRITAFSVEHMMENGADSEKLKNFLVKQSENYNKKIDDSFTGVYGVFNDVYIDGVGWVPDEDYVPEERPWYTAAVEEKGNIAIVLPYIDAQTSKIKLSVSQLLSDGKSCISLDIYLDMVQEIVDSFIDVNDGYGFVMDKSGIVIAHSDSTQNGKNYLTDSEFQDSPENLLAKDIIASKKISTNTTFKGKEYFVFSNVVHDSWYVVFMDDTSAVYSRIKNTVQSSIVLAILMILIIAFFCFESYRSHNKIINSAVELKEYQMTLEERVREQTYEIKKQSERMLMLQEDIIEGMATLIESRDGNTGEHVHNTKMYVMMILRYMYEHRIQSDEVTHDFVKNVTKAAVLHDVGKIKISDVILNKPGRFTEEEYNIMKKHADIGGDIVKDIFSEFENEELVDVAGDIARYHHEKWDGSGYPTGRSGKDIPLSARVMAVADVFDALVSKRVYKERMSVDEAFEVMQNDAGKHFDPEIVEIFLKIRPDVETYLREIEKLDKE